MNVLSLFDGISCGQIALQRAGIKVDNYYASEIDKHAIKVTQHNYPNTIQLGSVTDIKGTDLPQVDLLIGGSPCQGFSFAGKGLNFKDPRSKLFFEFVRLLKECQPKYFLLENVKMKRESEKVITDFLGVEPIKINSALVSAQNRERLYWTNIQNIEQPKDMGIIVKDIFEQSAFLSKYKVNKTKSREIMWGNGINGKCPNLSIRDKSWCLTTKQDRWNSAGLIEFEDFCRYITPIEAERLQTVPDNYTSIISDNKRYHALGNGWTVDVIAHILKNIPQQ